MGSRFTGTVDAMTRSRPLAIGMRPHSGWAAMVLVDAAAPGSPDGLIARERVELLEDDVPNQPYHAAKGLDAGEAAAIVGRVEAVAAAVASRWFADVFDSARASSREIVAVGVAATTPSIPRDVGAVLKSHALMHAAEGWLYTAALLEAAIAHGVTCLVVPPKQLADRATPVLGSSPEALAGVLAAMGREAGPPWRIDQRDATLAAWLAAAESRTAE